MTQKELAKLLKLSPATVSMALHGAGRISEQVRERVLALTRRHHIHVRKRYSKKDAGSTQGHTLRIGYCSVYHDIDAWMHAGAFRGMLEPSTGVVQSGHAITLFSSRLSYSDSPEAMQREYQRLKERVLEARLDGLILDPNPAFMKELLNVPLPKVMLGYFNFSPDALDAVVCDNFTAAYQLTRKLIEQGHRRIACLRCDPGAFNSLEKFSGYQAALMEAGLRMDPQLVVESNYESDHGSRVVKHLLALKNQLTAVFLDNDWLTGHFVNALRASGRVGRKCLDEWTFAHCEDSRKDTGLAEDIQRTELRPDLMGRLALRHLLDRITGRVSGEPVTLKVVPFYRSAGAKRAKRP